MTKLITKLITIPKFAEATGLPYRLCLHLIGTGQVPSVAVGRRRTPSQDRCALGGAMAGDRWLSLFGARSADTTSRGRARCQCW